MTAKKRDHIRFLLNEREIVLNKVPPTRTLLDFLRTEARLTGTKEGCAEGDCGACTVLVGRLSGEALAYETATSCILFLGALDGCHVVTVEHLAPTGETLHPVQQAMVDNHASQCGFCTPGIVMSLHSLWLRGGSPGREAIETALQGNLCRCTGYELIVRAGEAMGATAPSAETDRLTEMRDAVAAKLAGWRDAARVEIGDGAAGIVRPADIDDLAAAYGEHPGATLVAGSTDVGLWVTKQMKPIGPVIFLSHLDALQRIETCEADITLGAGVSYTRAAAALGERYPSMQAYLARIGGEQIRNMGTIGGNIANGSPIGDMPPPFIALGARLTLNRGGERRTLALEDFFLDYGRQDRREGEFVESVTLPGLAPAQRFVVYKVSKRRDEDISALTGAFNLTICDGSVEDAVIAFGGMAATPKRARHVEAALIGHGWNEETVEAALTAFESDFSPLSDWRASADYRMLAARNLLRRFYLEQAGAPVRLTRGASAERVPA